MKCNIGPIPRAGSRINAYSLLVLFIGGMGGVLYGYDLGIIGAALLYLDKTVSMTLTQESLVVAAVLGGGMLSSVVAGAIADLVGRKKVMIASAVIFVASVLLIVTAKDYLPLLMGRVMQGLSAGMIAVLVPLYLAECLPAAIRGRGTAAFQLLLTVGIVGALAVGSHYTKGVEAVDEGANGSSPLLALAQNDAWRAMFMSAIYPAIVFLAGTFLVTESPRWLFRNGREEQALAALKRSRTPEEANGEFRDMVRLQLLEGAGAGGRSGSIFHRKYAVPFLLACAVLGLTQATGVNSILQFVVVILQQAGLGAAAAAHKSTFITGVNVVFTIVGLVLVDRAGRKTLLMIGTGGIVVALLISALAFNRFESQRIDVTERLREAVHDRSLSLKADAAALGQSASEGAAQIVIVYAYGANERLAAARIDGSVLRIAPDPSGRSLVIKSARYGPVPGPGTAKLVTVSLMLFMASFAVGPGICVWLALSELMPTRIRSLGMGLGLLVNQGVSTGIAAVFLPFVAVHGYATMFLIWAACTAAYFLIAAAILPETKGKTLEEIEAVFQKTSKVALVS